MTDYALHRLPLRVRYLAEDFSVLILWRCPQWIMVRDELHRLH